MNNDWFNRLLDLTQQVRNVPPDQEWEVHVSAISLAIVQLCQEIHDAEHVLKVCVLIYVYTLTVDVMAGKTKIRDNHLEHLFMHFMLVLNSL